MGGGLPGFMSPVPAEALEMGSFCNFCISLQHMEFRNQQDLNHILTWQPPEVSPSQYLLDLLMPSFSPI